MTTQSSQVNDVVAALISARDVSAELNQTLQRGQGARTGG